MALRERRLQDGTKRWDVRYRPPGSRREISETFASKDRAQYREAELRMERSDGRLVASRRDVIRVKDAYESWIETRRRSVRRGQLKPKTLDDYENQWRLRIREAFGDTELKAVSPESVQRWADRLMDSGLGASSIRHAVSPLKAVFVHAVRTGMFAGANPVMAVELPALPPSEHVYLPKEDVIRLAALLGEQGDVALLLAFLGLRFGELVGLQVQDVDLARKRIHIRRSVTSVRGKQLVGTPKTRAGLRSVPVPTATLGPVFAHRTVGKAPSDALVTGPRGGPLRRENWIRDTGWNKVIVELGYPDLTPHSLRHTYASLARRAGGDLRLIQKSLGHASILTTAHIYSDLFDDELDAVADALDGL
ncbi:MAG: tyrosine-type recombinase/integrase [Aeromicrobium sp.]